MVATTTTTRKISPVYYAILDDQNGTLAKLDDGAIYFMEETTSALTEITPEHYPFLVTLGEYGIAEAAYFMDMMRGGAPAIACTRPN